MPFGLPSQGRISTSVCVGLCVSVRVQSFIQFCLMLPSNDNARQCVFYVSIKRVLWALLQRAIMLRVFRVLTDSHIRRLAFWVRRRTKFHQHQHHTRQVQAELKLSRRIRLNDSVSFFAPLNLHSTSCLAKFINTKVVGTQHGFNLQPGICNSMEICVWMRVRMFAVVTEHLRNSQVER